MTNTDQAPSPPPPDEANQVISALPDIASTPLDAKKREAFHEDVPNAEAGPSEVTNGTGGPVSSSVEQGKGREDEIPVLTAVPLPEVGVKAEDEDFFELKMTWRGSEFDLKLGGNDMVYDFRATIYNLTGVPAERQKVIGLGKGKLSAELDSTRFSQLEPKRGAKFMLIGTPEDMSFKDPSQVKLPEVFDDFDVTYPTHPSQREAAFVAPADDPRNKRKVEQIIKEVPITVMNEPRAGRKLLVLDLDYTIVDTKPLIAGSLPPEECARPGLHEFLELVYPHYDIVVWSQTHWRWLESKLVELGMIGSDRSYKVCFVSDRTTMFPVFTERNGKPYKHEVKPLAYFWASFPQWSAKNTIHIDDLSRNFAMNPGEGLRIRAFQGAATGEGFNDRELLKLGTYLTDLATIDDFTTMDHSRWKKGPRDQR